jgi:hypothetical protein
MPWDKNGTRVTLAITGLKPDFHPFVPLSHVPPKMGQRETKGGGGPKAGLVDHQPPRDVEAVSFRPLLTAHCSLLTA